MCHAKRKYSNTFPSQDKKVNTPREIIPIDTTANLTFGGVVFHLQKSLLGTVLALEMLFTKMPPIALTLKEWTFRGGFERDQTAPKSNFWGWF